MISANIFKYTCTYYIESITNRHSILFIYTYLCTSRLWVMGRKGKEKKSSRGRHILVEYIYASLSFVEALKYFLSFIFISIQLFKHDI